MPAKAFLTLCLVTASVSSFAQADQPVSCKQVVQEAIADEARRALPSGSRERDLCFPGNQYCFDQGGLGAQAIWNSAHDPDEVKDALLAYREYTGRVSEVAMPSKGGKIVRIGRLVGTASCVRDTYFLVQHGRYRLIDSPTLAELSAEAGNCGSGRITLQASGEPLLVSTFHGVVTAYRFSADFALEAVCNERYRAPRQAP